MLRTILLLLTASSPLVLARDLPETENGVNFEKFQNHELGTSIQEIDINNDNKPGNGPKIKKKQSLDGAQVQYVALNATQGYLVLDDGKVKCITGAKSESEWDQKMVNDSVSPTHLRGRVIRNNNDLTPCEVRDIDSIIADNHPDLQDKEVVIGGGDDNLNDKKKSKGAQVFTVLLLVLVGFAITYFCVKFFSKGKQSLVYIIFFFQIKKL